MNPERWKKAKALFGTVLETVPSERSALLDKLCAGDPSLRAEIQQLLAADSEAGNEFLNQPADYSDLLDDYSGNASPQVGRRLGRRVGPYELAERIGVGGMGEVYRAFRADSQYRKEVAVKLVKAGENSKFVIDRFRNERQVLANLDHPNIARLLDGGTTEEGEPYFVMELIHGQAITEYCDTHKLSVTRRLNLFLRVCSAVEYAHQRLIIHRDLKPSNILITHDGTPKLLDFGVAKILDPAQRLDSSEPTVALFRMLTPSYASPEQIKGETITTASDVYSLGVLLYELLTGHRPYRLSTSSPLEIANAACTVDPQRPSTAILRTEKDDDSGKTRITPESLSVSRDASPERLRHRLRGDLDNILLKALRKEPEHRYASVDQFATDIRRHLDNLPVSASRDTLRYRLSKFVRRHKKALAAATAVAMVLISGMVITMHEARIARQQRAQAERRLADVLGLADTLLFDVHDAIQNLPGATPARKLLVEKALQYLDVVRETGNDDPLKREVAYGYEKMGDVQGNPDQANLGDTAGALDSYRKALDIRQGLRSSGSEQEKDALWLIADYNKIGLCLLNKGDFNEALANFREAVRINADLTHKIHNLHTMESLAGSYFQLARGLTETGDFPAALETFQKAAIIRENERAETPPAQALIRTRLAGTYGYMSGVYSAEGDLEQAIASQTKSRDIMEQLLRQIPENAIYQEFTYEGYYWIGHYQQKAGRLTDARKNFDKAFTGFDRLAKADPADARAQQYLSDCYRSIGQLLTARGKINEGLTKIQYALRISQKLKQSDPSNIDKLTDIAYAQAAMADAYAALAQSSPTSRPSAAEKWLQARQWYESSLNTWNVVKGSGSISASDRGEPSRIEKQIQRCDAKLSSSSLAQRAASTSKP